MCLPLKRSTALASSLREELLNIAVCLSLINKGKPLSGVRVAPLFLWVPARRKRTDEYGVETLVKSYFFSVLEFK